MRVLRRNRQKMYFSNPNDLQPIYERDEDGNIIYIDVDGESVPIDTGEMELGFDEPVEFFANINGKLSEVTLEAFGIDNSMNYCEIVTNKDAFDMKIGAIIWRSSEIKYKADGNPDIDSADYVIRGVVKESLNEDRYLVKRLSVGDEKNG